MVAKLKLKGIDGRAPPGAYISIHDDQHNFKPICVSTQKIMTSQLVHPLLLCIFEVLRNYSSYYMPYSKVLYKTKLFLLDPS